MPLIVLFYFHTDIMSSSSHWPDEEEHTSKFMRKAKESPFVPIGKVNTGQPYHMVAFWSNLAFLHFPNFPNVLYCLVCMYSGCSIDNAVNTIIIIINYRVSQCNRKLP